MPESGPLAHSPTLIATAPPQEPGAAQLEAGATAGEYVVERFLGAGAMGEVYAGCHPVIGKKVAIKILRPELAASAEAAERFIREARAANQVDHPGVINVFAFGRLDDGRLYLVMDLVEGRSLRRALADGPLDVDTALSILAAVADALDAAHARGVVHRDLKPDNVMLGSGHPPAVHVLDFGIAKLLAAGDGAPPSTLTGKGTWLGTPAYMAPEQWSADGAGPGSDRYSFGVMAFEMLSGGLPFQAASLPAMMEQHFRAKVPALSSRGAIAAHATFDPVLARAMAKVPDARFATGRDMVEALRAAAGKSHAHARSASHRPWLPAAAGVGVLGLSLAAFLAIRTGGPGKAEPGERAIEASSLKLAEGRVRIDVRSHPPKAQVIRDGRFVGDTPMSIDVQVGDVLAFSVQKPGYASIDRTMTAEVGAVLAPFMLVPINGFEGVWALPTGELRAFQRIGDTVDVFKLANVGGGREFYRNFKLVPSDDPARIAFATTEDIIDPRAPSDPRCHIPHRTQYQYAMVNDALEVRREHVRVDVREGQCIILSSDLGAPIALARVDQGGDGRETIAPVGRPRSLDDLGPKQQRERSQKENVKRAPPKPKAPNVSPAKQPPLDGKAGALNDPGSRPAPTTADLRQQVQAPQALPKAALDAPNQAAQPRGDSQVAPPKAPAQQQAQKAKL